MKKLLFILILFAAFWSCNNDNNENVPEPGEGWFEINGVQYPVETCVIGMYSNDEQMPYFFVQLFDQEITKEQYQNLIVGEKDSLQELSGLNYISIEADFINDNFVYGDTAMCNTFGSQMNVKFYEALNPDLNSFDNEAVFSNLDGSYCFLFNHQETPTLFDFNATSGTMPITGEFEGGHLEADIYLDTNHLYWW